MDPPTSSALPQDLHLHRQYLLLSFIQCRHSNCKNDSSGNDLMKPSIKCWLIVERAKGKHFNNEWHNEDISMMYYFEWKSLKGALKALFRSFSGSYLYVVSLLMSPCFNVQKALYFSHTACAAAPLFTLCLKPEPSLL